jgi:hypothetical protein
VDPVRAVGPQEAPQAPPGTSQRRGHQKHARFEWRSLKAEHLGLVRDGWEPLPLPPEEPPEISTKLSGGRKLTDDDVANARREAATASVTFLAKKYGVSYKAMDNAVKGYSHRHLNILYPPRW